MPNLTMDGQGVLHDIAQRFGVSTGAASELLNALARGNGVQAKFNHPDLGGMGQWSKGGMVMVGDMFNHGLKARVNDLAAELADLLQRDELFSRGPNDRDLNKTEGSFSGTGRRSRWPEELGAYSASGSDGLLGALQRGEGLFPGARIVVAAVKGDMVRSRCGRAFSGGTVFAGQAGIRSKGSLTVTFRQLKSVAIEPPSDVFDQLRKLGDLRDAGVLTASEFEAKKAELLGRI